jgi:hypothetical protein
MSRSMVKMLHADNFFPEGDAENLRVTACQMNFIEKDYGYELENFNLIFPDIELIFNKVLGERVSVDPIRSGVIRKPFNNAIHFESFDSPDEWCFFVALEPTTINLWYHIEDSTMGEFSKPDSRSVFDGVKFNYRNLFEWKIHTNILLEQNQGIFIRPWIFHSLESGLVQYYRLISDNNYRILIMGYPGSKKDSVAKKLSERFQGCIVIDSMTERQKYKLMDLDYTEAGHMRHCYRMLKIARQSRSKITILNMSCPLEKMRQILNPDIIVWVSDKTNCEWKKVNEMYQIPKMFDIECKSDTDEDIDNIVKRVLTKRI